jgi:hypothetical protein
MGTGVDWGDRGIGSAAGWAGGVDVVESGDVCAESVGDRRGLCNGRRYVSDDCRCLRRCLGRGRGGVCRNGLGCGSGVCRNGLETFRLERSAKLACHRGFDRRRGRLNELANLFQLGEGGL